MTDIDLEEAKKSFELAAGADDEVVAIWGRLGLTIITKVGRLRELVEAQREYIQFLRDQPISGWTHIEAGKAIDFRLKIAEIEKEMG